MFLQRFLSWNRCVLNYVLSEGGCKVYEVFVVYEGLCIVWNRFCMKGYMFRVSKDRHASHKSDDVRFWVH